MCGRGDSTYYSEMDRHLKVRTEENVGISPLTSRKTKPSKQNAICDHLLNCNNVPFFLRILPFWLMKIINLFLKPKKSCLLNEIDLF